MTTQSRSSQASAESAERATAERPAPHRQVRFTDLPTYYTSELPTVTGKFDALHAWNAKVFGRLVSDSGNDGLAFSYQKPESREDLVFATVFANNRTLGQRRPSMQQLIAGTAPEARQPELKIQVRGKILATIGGIGEFEGIAPTATEADRDAAVSELLKVNPHLGNLVGKYNAVLDTSAGEQIRFLNSLQIPVKHLPEVIRDLSNANGGTGKQHVGAFRLAQVLEASMRKFEADRIIPEVSVDKKPIAVDRFAAELAKKKESAPAASPRAAQQGDDEPPF